MEDCKGNGSRDETPSKRTDSRGPHGFNHDSHVNVKYSHFTPPSRSARLRNPFEGHLAEKFHTTVFSPSVFKAPSQRVEDTFKWTIDDISYLKPADIDETAAELCDHHLDTTVESSVQAKIDLFFSKCVLPSPYNQESKSEPLLKEVETPVRAVRRTCEASTQTALSLPIDLPPEIKAVLQPYLNVDELECSEEEQQLDMALYRKLFDIEECDRSDGETIQSSPPKSLPSSPLPPLPSNLLHFEDNFENSFNLDECNLSPIRAQATSTVIRERKSATRIDFNEHMSVDTTSNLVPDMCGDMPKTEFNSFDCSYLSVKEENASAESVVNWDVEYNKMEVSTPTKSMQMDVSNSNTPKSSFSYRKKLSNSFANEDKPPKNYVYKPSGDTGDLTDLGYHTGATSVDDNFTNIYASTPSKRHSYRVT